MEDGQHYSAEQVSEDERLARIVLSPRDIDPNVVKGIVTDAVILDVMDELFHHLKYVSFTLGTK